MSSANADWYPDPEHPQQFERYWDGAAWTEHRRAIQTPAPQPEADGWGVQQSPAAQPQPQMQGVQAPAAAARHTVKAVRPLWQRPVFLIPAVLVIAVGGFLAYKATTGDDEPAASGAASWTTVAVADAAGGGSDPCGWANAESLAPFFGTSIPTPVPSVAPPSKQCDWASGATLPRVTVMVDTPFLYDMSKRDPEQTPLDGVGHPATLNHLRNELGASVDVSVPGKTIEVTVGGIDATDPRLVPFVKSVVATSGN